jgi:hypothetical protein
MTDKSDRTTNNAKRDLNPLPPIAGMQTTQLPFSPNDVGWGMSPVRNEEGDWLLYLEVWTNSAKMGLYFKLTHWAEFLEKGMMAAEDLRKHEIDNIQSERDRKAFTEEEAKRRVPLDVAEKIWQQINVDEDDDPDAIRNSMPLPAEPADRRSEPRDVQGRLSAPEEG